MKKFLNLALSIISPLASVPTGWAIFAGVTKQPAFPMNPWAAGIGAVAIIATSIAAGLLVVDIYAYNQSMKNKTEREELSMSAVSAWAVLALCVFAEIALSLLIVVIPDLLAYGVLAFPIMTAAGVFAFAVRYDLQQREASREAERATAKAEAEQKKLAKKAERSAQAKVEPATAEPQPATEPVKPAFVCSCGKSFGSQPALNAHKRSHKQVVGYAVSFEPVTKEQQK
jgi:signal transduction histidine kinase